MQGTLDELAGAVDTLLSDGTMNASRLFAPTSSEGAVHALNGQLAAGWRFAGLVLTGVPRRPVGEVARSQVLAQIEGPPDGERLVHRHDSAVAAFEAGEPVTPDPSVLRGQGAENIVRFIVVNG